VRSYDNLVALVLSIGVIAYLVYALLVPEKL
jgi:K+-transporting ATPase KdpF subunit